MDYLIKFPPSSLCRAPSCSVPAATIKGAAWCTCTTRVASPRRRESGRSACTVGPLRGWRGFSWKCTWPVPQRSISASYSLHNHSEWYLDRKYFAKYFLLGWLIKLEISLFRDLKFPTVNFFQLFSILLSIF